jgi:hypothetical protein
VPPRTAIAASTTPAGQPSHRSTIDEVASEVSVASTDSMAAAASARENRRSSVSSSTTVRCSRRRARSRQRTAAHRGDRHGRRRDIDEGLQRVDGVGGAELVQVVEQHHHRPVFFQGADQGGQ